MLLLLILILTVVFVLQAIAFFTLLERHVLGITQNRLGPKKVRFYGILQPLIDGLKLINKEQLIVYSVSPTIFLGVTLMRFLLVFGE